MKMTLIRDTFTSEATLGRLHIGEFSCFMLERSRDDTEYPCISAGTYKVEAYQSPTKGLVPLLLNVPGRSYIEIHPANYPDSLRGCLAPGLLRRKNAVYSSREAFREIMILITQAWSIDEPVTIEISELSSHQDQDS